MVAGPRRCCSASSPKMRKVPKEINPADIAIRYLRETLTLLSMTLVSETSGGEMFVSRHQDDDPRSAVS